MRILAELRDSGRSQDMQALLEQIPFARFLELAVVPEADELVLVMPFRERIVGNPRIPAIHGGILGAFLELTAVVQLLRDTSCERIPKTIDFSIGYLRTGRTVDTYGRAFVTRRGKRVANVRTEVWQEQEDRPIATGHGHFLLAPV